MVDRTLLAAALTAALAASLAAGPVRAGAAAQQADHSVLSSPDYKLETDNFDYNQNSGDFSMPHKVRFSRPGTDAVADRANGNEKRGTASLFGHVEVHDNGQAAEIKNSGGSEYNGPATLTCDQLDVDSRSGVYTAIGNVHFSQGESRGTAARGTLDRGRHTLHLEGDVHLDSGASSMTAQNVDYNLATKDVHVTGVPVIIRQPVPSDAPRPAGAATPKPAPKRRR